MRYFEHCAAESDRMTIQEYGKTYQGRPLVYSVLTSPENHQNLDKIQSAHLAMMDGAASTVDNKAIVWLSYGVHGNEAGASNSAPHVLYHLLTAPEEELEDVMIIIDPSLNPDGFSRYTNWYNDHGNQAPNHSHHASEHNEPSPSGRLNHYRHDLNRDWAWLTQIESQQRIKIYTQWMPHIHVDVHEQGINNPYYFAPAAIPYHNYITEFQRDFQKTIGQANAASFDKEAWLYFTGEIFDLLYPSYGDTYPTFSGAVGMTYEQAGHGRAGLSIQMENGHNLTLTDRILHHKTTSITTVHTAVAQKNQMIKAFGEFYGTKAPGKYKSYVLVHDGSEKLDDLTNLLKQHGIKYSHAVAGSSVKGYSYKTDKSASYTANARDVIVNVDQAKAILAQVLLDPETGVEDSLTYDITAWSLPKAYGLEAFASEALISGTEMKISDVGMAPIPEDQYAYYIRWNSLRDAKVLAALQAEDIKVRVSNGAFSTDNGTFTAGTLVILKAENHHKADYASRLLSIAKEHKVKVEYSNTGLTKNGPDMGSSQMAFLKKPKVMILNGDGVYANSFGEVWHFFEQELKYPVTVTEVGDLRTHVLEHYTTIVMPEGSYRDIKEETWTRISAWVSRGGKIISLGSSHRALSKSPALSLSTETDEDSEDEEEDGSMAKYGNQERDYIPYSIPGAIFHLSLDETHPLSYGIGDNYYCLISGTTGFSKQTSAWNVSQWKDENPVFGFAGAKALKSMKGSSIHLVKNHGGGQVIYLTENPLFRSFWYTGKMLFANAVFF